MSAPIMFWQHLSPSIPYFGQQDPQLRDGKLTQFPNFPQTYLITAKDCWWRFENSRLFRLGGDTRIGVSPVSVTFLLGQLKCSSVSKICRCLQTLIAALFVLFCFTSFFAPKTQWTSLADWILQAKCPLASVLASDKSWRELGAEQVLAVCKPYHCIPLLSDPWSDGCYSTCNTAEYKGGALTCNYKQLHIHTHGQRKPEHWQHILKLPLPEGPIYVSMLNTCYLLCMYCIVWVVHANQRVRQNGP